jgi:hypothetical protein
MVEDPNGRSVLYGGASSSLLNDTWVWDGNLWTQVADTGPSGRAASSLAYDPGRKRALLFGGSGSSAQWLGDTWEWDGTSWTQVADTGPSPRLGAAMTFDGANGRITLFGGSGSGAVLQRDTWIWDGAAWTQVADTGPSARAHAAIAYDGSKSWVVLHGGGMQFSWPLNVNETWIWDGKVWTQLLDMGPSPRSLHGLVFDSDRGRPVLFGGFGGNPTYFADTWELVSQ